MTRARADGSTQVRFTPHGEAAIEKLAAGWTAGCDETSQSIVRVFEGPAARLGTRSNQTGDDVIRTAVDELTDPPFSPRAPVLSVPAGR